MTESQRRLAAIVFTDMVGYSARVPVNERTALEVLERHNRLLRPLFPNIQEREVQTLGEAFPGEFDRALDSARYALEIQRARRAIVPSTTLTASAFTLHRPR